MRRNNLRIVLLIRFFLTLSMLCKNFSRHFEIFPPENRIWHLKCWSLFSWEKVSVCHLLNLRIAQLALNIGTSSWKLHSGSQSVLMSTTARILGNPGVIHYDTLHSSPLGQLTDETSFSMNIHNIEEYLNS